MIQPYSLQGLLLCTLRAGPDYGTNLAQRIATIDPAFQPRKSALYPALERLEDEGFARSVGVPPPADRGGRHRQVYTLTVKGRRHAEQLARFYALVGGTR